MRFTDRVTKGEDGVYRWFYMVDLKKDHHIRNTMLKVLAAILVLLLVMVVLIPDSATMSRWAISGIVLGVFAVVALIVMLTYCIMYGRRDWKYRFRYVMDEKGIQMLQEQTDINAMKTMGSVMSLLGSSSGAAMRNADANGYTSFRSVRKMTVERENELISLKALILTNRIYVREEDFDLVKDYLTDHLKSTAMIIGGGR